MQKLRIVLCFAALPLLLITLLGVGKHKGLFESYQIWKESKALYQQALAQKNKLIEERDAYVRLIEKLRSDPLEKEWLVRSFGYVRPGEKVFRIVHPTSPSQPDDRSSLGTVRGEMLPSSPHPLDLSP